MISEPARFEGRTLPDPNREAFDQGMHFDVATLMSRRRALALLGVSTLSIAAGTAIAATGCTSTQTGLSERSSGPGAGDATAGSELAESVAGAEDGCAIIPEETAGPFPADGSNGLNVLTDSGIARSDIRTSIGTASGTATGSPVAISLSILDADRDCAPYDGAAVYVWHCDAEGRYSMYSDGVLEENYLRGVQIADENGMVTFTSVFPGCYAGRWPHIHFEVYPDLDGAADAGNKIATSQVAIPQDACEAIYRDAAGYMASANNLKRVSLASDGVFGHDLAAHQLGSVTGGIDDDLTIALTVVVSATAEPSGSPSAPNRGSRPKPPGDGRGRHPAPPDGDKPTIEG